MHYRIPFQPTIFGLHWRSAIFGFTDEFGTFISKFDCLTIKNTNSICQRVRCNLHSHPFSEQPTALWAHTHTYKTTSCIKLTPQFVEIFRCDANLCTYVSLTIHIFYSFSMKSKMTFLFHTG